ncbi:MAG: hypothetical protein D6788_03335 [Planctomycetota bacterium]|nr:MAG: hypothetical protein D6788_03335 [Planctomycetota bacterium]
MKRAFSFGDKRIEPAVRALNAMRRIGIIGGGTMGQGIVIDLLRKTDYEIVLLDVSEDALQRAKARFDRLWTEEVESRRLHPDEAAKRRKRVRFTQDYADLASVELIWEVATERSDIKACIFEAVEKVADPTALLAVFSNTSSHTTAELAELFRSEALREKFLTVHGYYPFEANRLIDVMKGKYASEQTFLLGVVFADQILEKTVLALPLDHHGYITDPLFQAMAAIVSWDVREARDLTERGGVWELFTANPFRVLDQTGHMPYVESARHFGSSLPATDRLRNLYLRDGKHYPDWIATLQEKGFTGVHGNARRGFYAWTDGEPPRVEAVFDPQRGEYVPLQQPSRKEYWSYFEAAERDRRAGKIKSAASLVLVACANDAGGRAFRRYVLPLCLYALDLIQDGIATPGQINIATRVGLRFKTGLIECIDALIAHLTIDGLIELMRRAADENGDDPWMRDILDVDGTCGPRKGKPCWLFEMKRRGIERLLGYGKYHRTPVAELDPTSGGYRACYPELKFYPPSRKDRVASIVFHNPLRGNVFNRALLDQLAHAYQQVLDLHRRGRCGAVLFTASGEGMRMLGADAREFNRGWFERQRGYVPLSEAEAAAFTRNALDVFRTIQKSPVASIGVFGEKWGGGAEFTYFLDLRYDVRTHGYVFDTLTRESVWTQKTNYNQPELDYAILAGFGAPGELKRLGLGDSSIFEIFDQGMTADRAWQVGLSNGVFDDELEALRRGYERARLMAKDAPYSRALFKKELARGQDDELLARETGETFNPAKNPFIRTGLLALLDRGGRPPRMDYTCTSVELPGWTYPQDNGLAASGPIERGFHGNGESTA